MLHVYDKNNDNASNSEFNNFKKQGRFKRNPIVYNNFTAPKFVDFSDIITPVIDQGYCPTCWACAVTDVLSSQYAKKTGKLVQFSRQNLLDCVYPERKNKCEGGDMITALEYTLEHGIETELNYPFRGNHSICKIQNRESSFRPRLIALPMSTDEMVLKRMVASYGPIAIRYFATNKFINYDRSIFYDESCTPEVSNHVMMIVGYGTENGTDYWLVKNSWGTTWGLKGFAKIARNRENNCGVCQRFGTAFPRF